MPDIADIIAQAAQRYGYDPQAWQRIAGIESSMNPRATTGHARGLFQFMPQTWAQYGHGNIYDPAANTDAAMRYARDNEAAFTKAIGRPPTNGERYVMHQQGPGGAIKLLTHPDAMATDIVGAPAVLQNGGHRGQTAADFAQMWASKVDGDAAPSNGPIRGDFERGPTNVAAAPEAAPQENPLTLAFSQMAQARKQPKVLLGSGDVVV